MPNRSNWDDFDLMDGVPTFTADEQARIRRVCGELAEKYDKPFVEAQRTGRVPCIRRDQWLDMQKKIRDAERV